MPWYNPTDPKQRNLMLGGLAFFVAIVPFRMYVLGPKQETLDALQARMETLEGMNRQAQIISARGGGDIEERLALYERHVLKLEELIPAAEDLASLLDDITRVARRSNVEINRFNPEPSEPGAFYDRRSYDMAVIGEYHDVARFLTDVASLSRIVTPIEMDVQVFEQPLRFPEMESPVIASFRIATYVLPEAGAAPPAAPTEGQQ